MMNGGLLVPAIVSLVLASLLVALAFLFVFARRRMRIGLGGSDLPGRLLASVVRTMPDARREWGAAMLAELAILRHPVTRWRFALDCARVALFPPRQEGLMMNSQMRRIIITCGMAAVFGLMLVAPLAWLEIQNDPASRRNFWEIPIPLFVLLWLAPTASMLIALPLLRYLRAGEAMFERPLALLLRISFLALVSVLWIWLVYDQMPCFLGMPNCD